MKGKKKGMPIDTHNLEVEVVVTCEGEKKGTAIDTHNLEVEGTMTCEGKQGTSIGVLEIEMVRITRQLVMRK